MRARLSAIPALLALIASLVAASAASASAPSLTAAGGVPFPNRQYVLSLPPGSTVTASQIGVREQGRRVASLSVLPASVAGTRALGVILVIDTSSSMHGRSIAAAMRAARTFVAHRNPQQQVGVITFNSAPVVRLRPTSDSASLQSALATVPRVGHSTHIYDAVSAAVSLLRDAHISGGSVVVLSDGADTGSTTTQAQAAAAAHAAGTRIFSVGLHSRSFDPRALSALAQAGEGSYSEASSPGALAQIYDRLGAQLSNQFLIRYRSLARPHQRVRVVATLPGGGVASAAYTSPALPSVPLPPFHRSAWQSSSLPIAVSVLVALMIGLGLLVLLRARPPRRTLRTRMAGFVSGPVRERREERRPPSKRPAPRAERPAEVEGRWARFVEDLDVSRLAVTPSQLVAWTAVGSVALAALGVWFTGSAAGILLAVASPVLVRAVVSQRAKAQRSLFAEQLAENLQVVASAMRAGQSFSGALAVAVLDAPQPARREFEQVVADERLGVPLDEALGRVARRMRSRDLEQVQFVAALQRQTGGNMAEVLDKASETIRERGELRRLITTLTAQGRLSRWVLTGLPPGLLVAFSIINPGYVRPLFHTSGGRLVLVLAGVLLVAGSLVMKRLIDIEV